MNELMVDSSDLTAVKAEKINKVLLETEHWLDQLTSDQDDSILEAADKLFRLGIRRRGSILPRGRLLNAAATELTQEQLDLILAHLDSKDPKVRCKVTLALSEWGSNKEAGMVRQLLETTTDPDVLDYCTTTLGTIGGVEASLGLAWALFNTSGVKQLGVLRKIEELITGGSPDWTEGVDRIPGSFRLVGSGESAQKEALEAITEALNQTAHTADFKHEVYEVRRMIAR